MRLLEETSLSSGSTIGDGYIFKFISLTGFKELEHFAITATALLIVGGCIIVALVFRGRRLKTRHIPFSREAVISENLADDLENSSIPILAYNHVPHQIWSGLPDYFTAVQNITAVCSSSDTAAIQTDSFPETPPPSYEQALEMMNRH